MEGQNKELNLVEILKDCPKGTKLYSPIVGVVSLQEIDTRDEYPIKVRLVTGGDYMIVGSDESFTEGGKYKEYEDAECMLFPSKENRDWSTFKVEKPKWNPDTLQPFDKVLVRDDENNKWRGDFFLYKDESMPNYLYTCLRSEWRFCIPYNEETKHLLGTNQEAPEYYRV